MLVGRQAERSLIAGLLATVRGGDGGALVVRGEAGIGKTALLRQALDESDGLIVLRAAGVESEAEVPYAGLHELLRPILPQLERLPERQAAALAAALDVGPAAATSRFAVGAAALSLLSAAADEAPVLCVVDDAQWFDDESAGALVFAARRLRAEAVGVLMAARERDRRRFEAQGLPEIALGELDASEAEQLLARRAPHMHAEVRRRLVAAAGGNALALVELAAGLTEGEAAGIEPLPDPLPAGGQLQAGFVAGCRRRVAVGAWPE
jgi:predicted ATPase